MTMSKETYRQYATSTERVSVRRCYKYVHRATTAKSLLFDIEIRNLVLTQRYMHVVVLASWSPSSIHKVKVLPPRSAKSNSLLAGASLFLTAENSKKQLGHKFQTVPIVLMVPA
jgi:hypothetical protein